MRSLMRQPALSITKMTILSGPAPTSRAKASRVAWKASTLTVLNRNHTTWPLAGRDEAVKGEPLEAVATSGEGPPPLGRPHPTGQRLQAEAVLVEGPDLDVPLGVRRARLIHGVAEFFIRRLRLGRGRPIVRRPRRLPGQVQAPQIRPAPLRMHMRAADLGGNPWPPPCDRSKAHRPAAAPRQPRPAPPAAPRPEAVAPPCCAAAGRQEPPGLPRCTAAPASRSTAACNPSPPHTRKPPCPPPNATSSDSGCAGTPSVRQSIALIKLGCFKMDPKVPTSSSQITTSCDSPYGESQNMEINQEDSV